MDISKIDNLVWSTSPLHHQNTVLPCRTNEQIRAEIKEKLRTCREFQKSIQEADIGEQRLKLRPSFNSEATTETSSKSCVDDLDEFDLSPLDHAETFLSTEDSSDRDTMEQILENLSRLAILFAGLSHKMQNTIPLLNRATVAPQNAAACTSNTGKSSSLEKLAAIQAQEKEIDDDMARHVLHICLLSSKKVTLNEEKQKVLQEASEETVKTIKFTEDSAVKTLAAGGYTQEQSHGLETATEDVHQDLELSKGREHPNDIRARHEFQRSIYHQFVQRLASGTPENIASFIDGADGGNNNLKIEHAVRMFPFRDSKLTFQEVVQEVTVHPPAYCSWQALFTLLLIGIFHRNSLSENLPTLWHG